MQNKVRSEFYNDITRVLSLDTQAPIIVISPHLDDAVWSLGPVLKELAEHDHRVWIVNLFSLSLIVDDESSLPAAGTAIRKAEDAEVCQEVGCEKVLYLDFPDGVLRDHSPETIFDPKYETPTWLADMLTKALKESVPADAILLVPSGFGWHIDHQLAARVASKLAHRVIFYEDFPYAARTVRIKEAHAFLHEHNAKETRMPADSSVVAEHLRLYRLYTSQRAKHHEEQISSYLTDHGYGFWL
jgi:LmbE family N-acetylglucosaminyl deacetylase